MKQPDCLISVIICTYNRANRLDMLFEALIKLRSENNASTEFIFVDNNSSDNTQQKIESFAQLLSFPVRCLHENKKGSSAARNKGIFAASGEIIAFLDDDCFPDPDWLVNLQDYFSQQDVDVAGGKVLLFDPLDLPISIRTCDSEVCVEDISQVLGTIPGCNMAFRRHALDEVGVFDEDLGAGLPLAAEDVDLLYRAFRSGFSLRYTPVFCVYHNHGRRTERDAYLLNRSYVKGRGGFYAKYILHGDWAIAKRAYWEIFGLCRNAIKGVSRRNSKSYVLDIAFLTRGFSLVLWNIVIKNKHSLERR